MRVAHAEGSDVARSAAGRAGAEAVWLPTALLPRFGVHWAATDSNHVVASYRLDDTELELQLDLDDHGRLCSVVLERWGGTDAIGSWGRFSTLGDSSVWIADRRRVAVSTPRLSGIRVR